MEKKEAVIYIRTKPSIKKWLNAKMKKDGWDNLSAWFEEFAKDLMKKEKRAAARKK